MRPPKPPPDSVLARAAEARAEGNCWKVVARMVKRSEQTVRKWPLRYPDRWAAATRAATRRIIDDAAAEGTLRLRNLVRVGKDNVSHKAAWHLMFQRLEVAKLEAQATARLSPPPPSDAQLIADFVAAHSPEQLISLATNLLRTPLPERLALVGLQTEADGKRPAASEIPVPAGRGPAVTTPGHDGRLGFPGDGGPP